MTNNKASNIAVLQLEDSARLLQRQTLTLATSPMKKTSTAPELLSIQTSPEGDHRESTLVSPTRRVFMSFARCNGWRCRFHADDLAKTPISRRFIFQDEQKLRAILRRSNKLVDSGTHEMLEAMIAAGHGGVWLRLTIEQYASVVSPSGRMRG